MSRPTCYRCFWPKAHCWCGSITPMATRTKFVLLMHPKEFKHEKAATGRLTHLCLANSEIHCGIEFDRHEAVQKLIADERNRCVLLYPGTDARNLSLGARASGPLSDLAGETPALPGKQLVVFILDATWALGRKMLKLNPTLQRLPKIMFTPSAPSRYLIKQQPHPGCLSTLEAVHELLVVLERQGLDRYAQPEQLLGLFGRMQDFQIQCAADPARPGYRRRAYSPPALRASCKGRSGVRRMKVFQTP